MGLRDDLLSGARGVRLELPRDLLIVEEREKVLVGNEPQSAVRWEIRVLPWRLDLDAGNVAVLRADVEADARANFEEIARAHNGGAAPPQSRLATPLLEVSTVSAGEGLALRSIHRALYQPGAELVIGTLVAPAAAGLVRIELSARDTTTGLRESILTAEAAVTASERPAFDDEVHDARFPTHALSRVRAALSWALSPSGGGLIAHAPPPRLAAEEIELAEAGCTIRPPPRFLPVAAEVMGMSPGIESLTRIAIATKPRLLDVWNLGPTPFHDASALESAARETVLGWEKEGASDIAVETVRRAGARDELTVDCFVTFRVAGSLTQSVQRWFSRDGVLVRVSTGGPLHLDRDSLLEDVAGVTESLRLLAAAPKKPWWKRW